jgi:hypothetical protein
MEHPKLIARFIPQAWVGESAIDINGAQDFDATSAIRNFTVQQVRPLKDNHDMSDDLALELPECKRHIAAGLPYRVEVVTNLDKWLAEFGVTDRAEMSEGQWKEVVAKLPYTIELKVNHDALFERFKDDSAHHIDQLWRQSNETIRRHLQGALAGLNVMIASVGSTEALANFRTHLDGQTAKIADKNQEAHS